MNLGIVILYVHDIEKAKAFYSGVVGLPMVAEQSNDQFIFLQPAAGSILALQDIATTSANAHSVAGSTEIGLVVDDPDAVWKRWKDQGVELVTEVEDKPFGRYFLAKDPEGHFVSVYRPVEG